MERVDLDVSEYEHRSADELEAELPHLRAAPSDDGVVEFLVARPANGARTILRQAELSVSEGLLGDNWRARGSREGPADPNAQLNVINARVSALLSADADHRSMAGDQLHLDLDLSHENLPAGTRLQIGPAIIEVTEKPHNGCAKFRARFGEEALRFVNQGEGKERRFRGLNAKVVQAGTVTVGDAVRKI
jgi:hypothetical protein